MESFVLECAHMMVNLMRTNQRWLMMIIVFLVSVSLVVFYSNRTDVDRMASNRVGSLYGQSVSSNDFSLIQRRLDVAGHLGTYEVVRAATEDGYDQQGGPINYLVLAHEAERLGIHPSDEEVRVAGEQLTAFQGPNGEYDPQRYAAFVDSQLNWRGMGPNQIDELVRMNLMVAKLRAVVTATVVVSPQEVRTSYEERFARTEASVIRLKAADDAAAPEPNEEEIKKYFNDQKDQFKQPERRVVQYVKFALDDTQQKLKGKERVDVLTPLASQAEQFTDKLVDGKGKTEFAALASADKLAVHDTPEFEANATGGFPEAGVPGFVQAAFKLTPASPDSDVPLETPDAYYDLHLSRVVPERPLTLEEARPKIVAAIKAERASAALTAKAEEIRTKITEALRAGRSFADAAREAGQTAQDVPPFSLGEPSGSAPEAREVAGVSLGLASGELSKFTPDQDGGFFVYVRGRTPADEAKFQAGQNAFAARLQSQKSELFFFEWLRASRDSAKPQFNLRAQS